MTRRHIAVACVVAALALGSALDLRAQRASAPTGSAALTVVVSTDDGTSRPLRRASVSLQANELGVPRTAMTGDDGRAVFEGLPAGNFLVSAARPGYVRTFHGSSVPGGGPGIAVALVEKQRLEIRLHVLRGAVISGVVRTPGGRPAANLPVQAVSARSRTQRQSIFYDPGAGGGQTDDRGAYRIFGLPPGEYVVSVRSLVRDEVRIVTTAELQWADRIASGSGNTGGVPAGGGAPAVAPSAAFAPVYYPGTPVVAEATPIRLVAGEERLGVDFALQLVPTAQLRGRLVDADGRPQPNQSITARQAQPGGSDVFQMIEATFGVSARTGADGSFTMNNLRPGRYTVEARATPRTADEVAAPPPAPGPFRTGTHWVRQEIAVAGADITDVTLVLRPGLTITGRVVYEGMTLTPPAGPVTQVFRLIPADADPVTGMAMSIMTESRVGVAADGSFSVAGVAPGQYRVVTQNTLIASMAPNAVASAGGWVLKSAMARGRDVADAPLEVRAGEDVSGVVVTFTDRPTSVTGQVFDQAGRVTANFPIVIFSTDRAAWAPSSRRIRLVRPATDGRFAAVGLPPGEYHVAAVTAVEPDQLADRAFLEQLAAMSIRLVLADGEQKTQDLKLGGG